MQAAAALTLQALQARRVAAPSPSSPPVDVDAAFAQFLNAEKPYWCSSAYFEIDDMAVKGNVGAMRIRVHEYRGVIMTWGAFHSG